MERLLCNSSMSADSVTTALIVVEAPRSLDTRATVCASLSAVMSGTARRQLHELLLTLFSVASLRQFIRHGEHAGALVPNLPTDPLTPNELVAATLEELIRRNLVHWLFAELHREFPRRHDDIAAVERAWSSAPSTDLTMLAGFRRIMAATHGSLRLVGLAHTRIGPVRALQDTFVPPMLRRVTYRTPWSPVRLLAHLLARRATPLRVVVLGDPGSGKTTLFRFLTLVLAGAATLEGVDVPADIAPLHLVVRDYGDVRRFDSPALLDHLAARARSSGASVTRSDLEELCTRGRAVLLVDGLDEAGDPARREALRDRLLGFCALYPDVPLCVSTRVIGYEEARLPDNFLHLSLEPLDDDALHALVHHWYAALVPDDADARARGASDLLASIEAEPAVRELARNPLLATLIALIHRDTTRLPGERVKLYELCVRTLLEKWPAGRGNAFEAIDIGAQRRLLERLAAHLSTERSSLHGSPQFVIPQVLVDREDLVRFLAELLRREEPDAGDARPRVRRWIQFLHDESGLLSEYGPERYAFAHRMLQDYLAAACYARTWPDPTQIVFDHRKRAEYREIWLMIVGLLSADASACERLYHRFAETDDDDAWMFLLACLGEEAGFSSQAVAEILTRAARLANTHFPGIASALARLWRFSKRHVHSVSRWFLERISTQPAGLVPLVGLAAAAAPAITPILRALDERPDRARVAAALAVAYWPCETGRYDASVVSWRELGRWAWSHIDLPEACDNMASRRWHADEVCGVAFTTLQANLGGPVRAAATLQLTLDTLRAPPGIVEPPSLVVEAGALRVALAHRLPLRLEGRRDDGPAFAEDSHTRTLYRRTQALTDFKPCLDEGGSLDVNDLSHKACGSLNPFAYLVDPDTPRLGDFFAAEFEVGFVDDHPDEFGDRMECEPGNATPASEFQEGIHDSMYRLVVTPSSEQLAVPPPDAARTPDLYDFSASLSLARAAADPAAAVFDAVRDLHVTHAAHILAAAASFAGNRPLKERAAVQRQQHVWLLQNWHGLERLLTDLESPVDLGLLLAFGWVQCTTTLVWPGTTRWRQLLGGSAPTHWWPRIQWHLCWLLHMPDQPSRHAEIDAALTQGEPDPNLGHLARILRSAWSLAKTD